MRAGRADRNAPVHKHAEAFMLMKYANKDKRIVEFIWNSRDGVTPFIIMSKCGTTELAHVMPGGDRYWPNFLPPVGSRIFRNMSRGSYYAKTLQRLKGYFEEDTEYGRKFQDSYAGKSPEEVAELWTEEGYYDGSPELVEVTEDVLVEMGLNERTAQRKQEIENSQTLLHRMSQLARVEQVLRDRDIPLEEKRFDAGSGLTRQQRNQRFANELQGIVNQIRSGDICDISLSYKRTNGEFCQLFYKFRDE